ncbi:MAG TPA: ATP synthase F1 subunit delta [Bacteroidia bacterium]|jgi:F-type H+-transporting ATPase subunit delta|nr:ATP synthase F1 subunit delta [Bacteroidia bacterium]
MEGTRVAARYAKSFIDLTMEQGVLEQAYADMKLIAEVSAENPELIALLKSPIIKTDKKQAILKDIFGSKINKLTSTYLQLITSRRRETYLPEVAEEFINQYKEKKKILTAVIITADGIDDDIREKVMELVKNSSNSEVVLKEKINKAIIGGFILRIGDKQVDASIARKLNNLKRNFKENPFVKDF